MPGKGMVESNSGRVICHCAGITAKRIAQHRRDHPDVPPETICQTLGCAVQCGSCRPAVLEILGHHAWWSARWQAVRHSTGHTADHVQRAI
jgi:bacterioferritin-associated ferredoxin